MDTSDSSSPQRQVYYLDELDKILGISSVPQFDAAAARKRRVAEENKESSRPNKAPRKLSEFATFNKHRIERPDPQPDIAYVFLSDEQKTIAKMVSEGHSVFFTGSAGMFFCDPSSTLYLMSSRQVLGSLFCFAISFAISKRNFQTMKWQSE